MLSENSFQAENITKGRFFMLNNLETDLLGTNIMVKTNGNKLQTSNIKKNLAEAFRNMPLREVCFTSNCVIYKIANMFSSQILFLGIFMLSHRYYTILCCSQTKNSI